MDNEFNWGGFLIFLGAVGSSAAILLWYYSLPDRTDRISKKLQDNLSQPFLVAMIPLSAANAAMDPVAWKIWAAIGWVLIVIWDWHAVRRRKSS